MLDDIQIIDKNIKLSSVWFTREIKISFINNTSEKDIKRY